MTANPTLAATAEMLGSFFTSLGGGIGRAAARSHEAVDGDARRDIAWVPVLALASVGPRFPELKALPDDGFRPVIFVHGLAGYRGNFLPMRTWLRLHGRTRSYSIGLKSRTMVEQAEELRSYIARVLVINGLKGKQVDIVAHSAGGLVSRLALKDPKTAGRVHRLVTLGTPHGGTWAARFTGTRFTTSLRRDSGVIARLESDVPWRRPTKLVCFWSPADPLMQPAETARVDGADNREIAGFSHLDWLMKRQAWMAVDEALRD
ncbi:MAG: hypothetical protein KDA24_09610 [Deltaproteobacteria bacterium]|nr:hypothetical protein [Deltaproteobacteria bacterium]